VEEGSEAGQVFSQQSGWSASNCELFGLDRLVGERAENGIILEMSCDKLAFVANDPGSFNELKQAYQFFAS
jgi:hypothetical protein